MATCNALSIRLLFRRYRTPAQCAVYVSILPCIFMRYFIVRAAPGVMFMAYGMASSLTPKNGDSRNNVL